MRRVILHIDMDYFFAQIEERENPQFKGKPVVIGADPKKGKGRGVVSTCNYEAREYGIHSALPISMAYQLCPTAIFLPVNMELYQQVSERVMQVVKKYSPLFEQVSLDEAYLDLSGYFAITNKIDENKKWKRAEKIAEELKKEILKEEKLTSTIGIGQNKLIAKMASERAKPDGLLFIKPNQVKSFLEPLDIGDLPGIGSKTSQRFRAIGINKIKELKKLSKLKLKEMFGKVGETFYENSRGIDEELVVSNRVVKSIGKECTFEKDTRNPEIIFGTFDKIIKEVERELLGNKFYYKTITVICRFQGFETHTKSKTFEKPSQDFTVLQREAKKLLLKFIIENPKLIRLIGLRIKF